MEFGYPAGWWWALMAAPIIILYILRIRLRRQPVSTLLFWNQIFEEKRPRSIWQRLRHLVSLLLQLAFLALLVGALIDPFWSWERLQARRIVLVLDNSASMNATDVDPTRLEEAKRMAQRLIRGLRLRDQMAIVSAGSRARVEVGLTGHQRTLINTLHGIAPTDGPTQVADAIRLAGRLLADHENATVQVLTDGCYASADPGQPEASSEEGSPAGARDSATVEYVLVGDRTDNVGITQFQARRSLNDPIGYQILVEVSNFSESPASCRLELTLGEDLVDVVPLELDPEQRWRKAIDHVSADGGQLVATLDRDDALLTDNRAVALLPQRRPIPVTLVTAGSLFLQRVFEAIPLVELTMTDTLPTQLPDRSITVLHESVREAMPPGNLLVIGVDKASPLWDLGEPLDIPLVAQQDEDSLLMRHVRLQNVVLPDARRLVMKTEVVPLASSVEGDPMYVAIDRPGGKVLILNVALGKGDLPLRIAFPVMMTNAITWFLGDEGQLREAASTGSHLEVDLGPLLDPAGGTGESPGNVATGGDQEPALARSLAPTSDESGEGGLVTGPPLSLRAPDDSLQPLPPAVRRATIGPLDLCGVWQVESTDAAAAGSPPTMQPLRYACNLANAEESDIRARVESAEVAGLSPFGIGGRPIWFYLIALALVLTATEWYLYQRRWIS